MDTYRKCIWRKILINITCRRHKHFNKLIEQSFELKSSVTLRRDKNGRYFADVFFEKKTEQLKEGNNVLGIDIGINKLMVCSNNNFLGIEIKQLLIKLGRKKQYSKGYYRCLKEIKHYIDYYVNKIDWNNVDVIVMENLKNITKNTKGRINKVVRKWFHNWNIRLLFGRIKDRCEFNRVKFVSICAKYTSQKCSSCGEIHKESRKSELYNCVKCDNQLDADYNASLNIMNNYLANECTVH